MSTKIRLRTLSLALLAGAAVTVATACSSDDPVSPGPAAPKGIIVMDGYVQPGLNLLGDTGTAVTRLNFGPSSEFDASVFTYERDTVLAVSSSFAGDFLYIADVARGTVKRVQLPTGGNAARARLTSGGNGSARIITALRDSQVVAIVTVSATGSPTFERIMDAGYCPTDAFRHDNATWVVDVNAECKTDYSLRGPIRLIRIPDGGGARDTVSISQLRGSAANLDVKGGVLTIVSFGDADFSAFPYVLRSPSAIAQVDLGTRQVLRQSTLLGNSYGATLRRGLDGALYVSLYESLATFAERVMQFDDNMSLATGSPATPLGLRILFDENNDEVACGSATADALGRLHCISTGVGSATTLHVFDAAGHEVRSVAAGQGGVDLAIRP